ncbi:hypothetical protein NW762_000504 [Fusarium torreyae]|uniref:Mid2 domain-containing protein n=1 Tax=Fusarium torreyae TaxID=1237075 RepID=A0A9W8SHK3_9HYPO|nr:hypothetical protein NW762_000504 [Fusarium torreyae]
MANNADRESPADLLKDTANSPATTGEGIAAASPTASAGGQPDDSGKSKGGISDDNEPEVIIFSESNFKDGRVFKIGSGTEKEIGFTVNDTKIVTPIGVKWQTMDDRIGAGQFKGYERTGQVTSVSNNSVSLNFTFASSDKKWYGDDMYIQVDWQTDWAKGYTRTPLFTVTESSNENEIEKLEDQLEKDDREQEPLESTMPVAASSTSDSQATSSSGIEDSDSSSDGGGGGGLSTGAKAGIAVGAVIGGLLIIGALVFFLLRRRRRNKKPSDEYITQQTYAVDKETHGRTTDSPNSPYSDENHMQPVALDSLDRDRGTSATPPPGGVPRSSTGSRGRGGNSGAQTPQGMSSNVAHLVEDGMTADEIRRLEEEERQLDDEIERAARR